MYHNFIDINIYLIIIIIIRLYVDQTLLELLKVNTYQCDIINIVTFRLLATQSIL